MTKIYGPDDVAAARRMINGLLPGGVFSSVSTINQGLTLSVLVQNGPYICGYEFGWTGRTSTSPGKPAPSFSRQAAIDIAEQWENGVYRPPAPSAKPEARPPLYVRNRAEFTQWLVSRSSPRDAVYFTGNLAQFRQKAQRRLVEINRIEDRGSGRMPLKASLRRERAALQTTQEMLQQIDKSLKHGLIALSQRRMGPDINYLATKVNAMPVNPAAVIKRQNLVRNAIQHHWAKYANQPNGFKILSIDFEGSEDEIHNRTAKIEAYRDSPQQPTVFRIPIVDLGDVQQSWGPILEQKAAALKKLIRARAGRERTAPQSSAIVKG